MWHNVDYGKYFNDLGSNPRFIAHHTHHCNNRKEEDVCGVLLLFARRILAGLCVEIRGLAIADIAIGRVLLLDLADHDFTGYRETRSHGHHMSDVDHYRGMTTRTL